MLIGKMKLGWFHPISLKFTVFLCYFPMLIASLHHSDGASMDIRQRSIPRSFPHFPETKFQLERDTLGQFQHSLHVSFNERHPRIKRESIANSGPTNGSPPRAEAEAEILGLQEKVKNLRSQLRLKEKDVKRLDTQNKQLREIKKESDWLKATFLKNENWDTDLHLAVNRKDESAVKRLVEGGAFVNARDKKLETPLKWAAVGNDKGVCIRIIKYLINNGANAYAKDNVNRTFLHELVVYGTTLTPSQLHDMSTYLVSKSLASLFNLPGYTSGTNPLQMTLKNIEVEIRTLKLLHANGVNFAVLDPIHGSSVLLYALHGKRSTKLLSDLVDLGVDWKHRDIYNSTALYYAAQNCHEGGVKYLIDKGLNVNALDKWHVTPLSYAVHFANCNALKTFQVLIENGANVKIKDIFGRTALADALKRNDLIEKDKVVELLRRSE